MSVDVMSKDYWGPRIWRLLHTMSCSPYVGQAMSAVAAQDERVAWLQLLKAQADVLPCARCRQHYREWFMAVGVVRNVMNVVGAEFGAYIRGSIFDLHCSANVNRGVAPAPIPYTDLESAYPPCQLTPIVNELDATFNRAVELRAIPVERVKLWRRSIHTLLGLYGLL
jgi:hypothetical protein